MTAMTPAPGTGSMPTPDASVQAPVSASPEAGTVQAAPTPIVAEKHVDLSTQPQNAAAAASHQNQAEAHANAQAEAAPEAAPAPAAAPATSTGNVAFDQVAALMADKGVANYSDILIEAAGGEISFASKAALIESMGAPLAEMVMGQLNTEASNLQAANTAEATRLQNKAAEVFGFSEDRAADVWADIETFVKSPEAGLSEADRAAMNNMLKAGGIQGDMVIADIAARFQKSQGFQKPANLLAGDGAPSTAFVPMTKQAYQAEMATAVKTFGYNSREAEALRNRRSASMQKGY